MATTENTNTTATQVSEQEVKPTANLEEINVDVRLLGTPQGKMIGLATVEYHGFKMDNFKVFNGENGLFISEPTVRDNRSNNFFKTIYVTNKELKDALNQKAFDGYNLAVEKLNARVAEAKKMEVKPSMKEQFANGAKQAAEHNAKASPGKGDKTKAVELG